MEKEKYEQLSHEEVEKFEEENMTEEQKIESAIREKEYDLTGVSAELVAKCNLHFNKNKFLISGKIDGHDIELTEYSDNKCVGKVDGVQLGGEEAAKLYEKYKLIAWMQSGGFYKDAKKEIDEESYKKTVDELLNL